MTNDRRIYLSPPHIGEAEQRYVAEAFATNWIAPLGPNVDEFERELASKVASPGALALSSGTAALHLALRVAGIGKGDTVFVSSLTFVASVNPILYEGAEPVFIDADFETWNMSPKALEQALLTTRKEGRLPKAVIVVSLYGQSADMDPIIELCERFGVLVIEDAAESLGATYKGKASGTLGSYGVYSFNGNKIITTSGGGMLVSNNLEALAKVRYWATQSRDPALHYEHSEIGYNYRMSNLLAGIGRGQLEVLENRVAARRAVYDRYEQAFSHLDGISFMPEADYGTSTRWLTALTINPRMTGITATELVRTLAAENIEARPVWKPMHLQPLLRKYDYFPASSQYSVSDQLFAQGICLPSGSSLSIQDQERVVAIIAHQIESRRKTHESA
ncbi:putative pyridoxal phosphate-dependent aminotransferase EpsN [Paenibacillus baekrokdamisoli]|uniref:Putative pyridoxal phosphate-dependent aminotransferase EpsN n=1 Tax=Paenibacillus baekrokdamisoli TaxID=1712516 RepID=A0A3G9J142_9BACL|nr:aminotransferase class I/II-fold pyridoxal phosphate-dependent enzyme [Paenibacillus baekrokdamisoli]MBB3067240.1 pyridoxal phosphate-dependent aminotransferase EpsN [Paenibacillus baekrokdamisoli]BBH19571.1 putative pyridoxal phosphate-dependent aminotransferase EpsN [Paenibacillus baekrokdamisoli]